MTYSEFIEEVHSELGFYSIELGVVEDKVKDYCNSGLIGDPSAEYDDEEFDEGDVDNAVDMIDTELGGE
tara:strand:+ start:2598 stop:2804 length:207 start_codon:yes stop_codon:yes gene_type:complete